VEIVKLKRTNLNGYGLSGKVNPKTILYSLVFFLLEECWSSTPKYIEWIKKVNHTGLGFGCSYHTMRYENGNIIIIYDEDFDEEEEEEPNQKAATDPTNFVTTREHMLEILTEWNRIINSEPQPEEVILTYDGEKVRFMIHN
jgi:hypothetical protein